MTKSCNPNASLPLWIIKIKIFHRMPTWIWAILIIIRQNKILVLRPINIYKITITHTLQTKIKMRFYLWISNQISPISKAWSWNTRKFFQHRNLHAQYRIIISQVIIIFSTNSGPNKIIRKCILIKERIALPNHKSINQWEQVRCLMNMLGIEWLIRLKEF